MSTYAHSASVTGERHSLRDHLRGTAELAYTFADAFGAGDAGYSLGLLHDAGKVAPKWQERLLALEAGRPAARVDHKSLGCVLARMPTGDAGSAAVFGHHGGMPNISRETLPLTADEELRTLFLAELPEAAEILDGRRQLPESWVQESLRGNRGVLEFGTRLLHSALVDADFLDTAAHFNATPFSVRPDADFALLASGFEDQRLQLLKGRPSSPVDARRAEVYQACVESAAVAPGVFRLAAPTGSGKTIAAAGFALHHAARHRKRRVVVAVPFLTITEQNAEVYRSLLGEDAVIEHHSAVEPHRRDRYGVENWDAPFVITTTVQLFESLFSNRPSKTRKLHRLVDSVIVLDEVQALPSAMLPTILDGLRLLVEHFGVTVLLASATQPTFEALRPFKDANIRPTEIIKDPPNLYRSLCRTRTEWWQVPTVAEIVERMADESQALVIVNTTANARDLARKLGERTPGEVFHLSTRMCQAHRRQVLEQVKQRLSAGAQVRLVSTQLIEAGVDVDFPVVYRAMAPAESLVQAAGRANREGQRTTGALVVIDCDELRTLKSYRTGIAKTRAVFGEGQAELHDPEAMARYYTSLYTALNLEDQAVTRDLARARGRFSFEDVARFFRMIDEDSVTTIVPYNDAAEATLTEIEKHVDANGTPTREHLRGLQPFAIALPSHLAARPDVAAYLHEPVPGLRVWRGAYDELVGIDVDGGPQDTVW